MSARAIVWSTLVSAGTHLLGLASAPALFVALAPVPVPVPIEVVSAPAPVPESSPPTPPRRLREPAVSRRATQRTTPPAETHPPELLESAPMETSPSPRTSMDVLAGAPPTAERLPLPEPALGGGMGSFLIAPGSRGAGPSLLSERGDVASGLVRAPFGRGTAEIDRGSPGSVESAIGRATGREAAGMVAPGAVATLAPPAGPRGAEGPITAFVRPLGGYQLTPPYPDSARRQGVQGTTRLRFEVLATGRVGQVIVDQSAGHADLDRAAVDAVRQWRFEPARRGEEPVAVWVTLPVRFELR